MSIKGNDSVENFHKRLGKVPLARILTRPIVGQATEGDVVAALNAPEKLLCELVEERLMSQRQGVKGLRHEVREPGNKETREESYIQPTTYHLPSTIYPTPCVENF